MVDEAGDNDRMIEKEKKKGKKETNKEKEKQKSDRKRWEDEKVTQTINRVIAESTSYLAMFMPENLNRRRRILSNVESSKVSVSK